jgi:hypothetical protein
MRCSSHCTRCEAAMSSCIEGDRLVRSRHLSRSAKGPPVPPKIASVPNSKPLPAAPIPIQRRCIRRRRRVQNPSQALRRFEGYRSHQLCSGSWAFHYGSSRLWFSYQSSRKKMPCLASIDGLERYCCRKTAESPFKMTSRIQTTARRSQSY